MSWNKEGQSVAGTYLGSFLVIGTVTESRVKYGGHVQHKIQLDTPLEVLGEMRDVLLLAETDLFNPGRAWQARCINPIFKEQQ